MIIQPKIRGFICTAAHPTGCNAAVLQQIQYAKAHPLKNAPKRVLVIGYSTGYGLASRIIATFAGGACTIGVALERAADEKRTASPGWYNAASFEREAHAEGYYAKSINGDAFSDAIKQQTVELIKQDLGQVDLVIYSLASPRRTHPETGMTYQSTLKPIDRTYHSKTVDAFQSTVKPVDLEPATPEEIENTIAVMGGDDWKRWIHALQQGDVLAKGAKTFAFSYIGPTLTHPIYKNGTIGRAKDDLHQAAATLRQELSAIGGDARIAVLKAVVTQASAAIPVVPLYLALLFKHMKARGTHEGCIEQLGRLFHEAICEESPHYDEHGYIRLDNLELEESLQKTISQEWPLITSENVEANTDLAGYRQEFYQLFGFGLNGVDYTKDVDPVMAVPSLQRS